LGWSVSTCGLKAEPRTLPIYSRRRASERALVISLAVASLVSTGEAFGQVRSTIQARARVVEAGPAWAASEAIREAVAAAAARILSPSYEFSLGQILSIERGYDRDGIPAPRVSIFREVSTMKADRCSVDGEAGAEPQHSDARLWRSTSCSLGTHEWVSSRSEILRPILLESDEPPRLIVYVEHVSN